MKKRLMTVFLAICMLLACAGCAKNADSKIQTKSSTSAKKAEITVAGSTAFEPLVKQAVKSYAQFNPSVKVNVLGGGSQAGLNQVDQGKVEIGTLASLLSPIKNSRSTIFQLRSLKTFSQAKSPTGNKSAEKTKRSPSSVVRTEAAPERHLN